MCCSSSQMFQIFSKIVLNSTLLAFSCLNLSQTVSSSLCFSQIVLSSSQMVLVCFELYQDVWTQVVLNCFEFLSRCLKLSKIVSSCLKLSHFFLKFSWVPLELFGIVLSTSWFFSEIVLCLSWVVYNYIFIAKKRHSTTITALNYLP